MITEDYCSYEVSKLLNEKGLNGMCDTVIGRDGTKYDIKLYDYVEEETTSCPTHQMAMKWLREEDIDIIIMPLFKLKEGRIYCYEIHSDNTDVRFGRFETYEEAVEAALKFVLEKFEITQPKRAH